MMFFLTMMTGSIITISSHSWMGMWIGLEINLLSIIPLLKSSNNTNSTEAAIKYFITQTMASNILLMSILMMIFMDSMISPIISPLWMVTQTALFIKMGAAPFHAWFPEVLSGLSWLNCLLMLTWQKIAPMIILMNIFKNSFFINSIIIFSALIGTIMGMNQINLRKIMAYSSINHISWMISTLMSMKSLWILYFSIYSIITINILLFLNFYNLNQVNQITSIMMNNKIANIFFNMNFFSLGGLPPFLGFLPKWLTIQYLLYTENFFLAIFLTIMTLVAMFYYLRISFPSILLKSQKSIKFNSKIKFIWLVTNMWSLFGLLLACSMMNLF
uniref:NADH-ubiquinone oxidoreductase chain 2 n=1 Tax=Physosmaragdina nigrifrons TaxID=1453301 RepID=A0A890CD72_9CUCU|nr:NADH dehydrogenase subunit 2 [Physosmaragdina nigrifrons]QRG29977.1 NADH dehydrogenase subunit 2 [Physosmaragdina nigrifrons]